MRNSNRITSEEFELVKEAAFYYVSFEKWSLATKLIAQLGRVLHGPDWASRNGRPYTLSTADQILSPVVIDGLGTRRWAYLANAVSQIGKDKNFYHSVPCPEILNPGLF